VEDEAPAVVDFVMMPLTAAAPVSFGIDALYGILKHRFVNSVISPAEC